jgi:hypothetical protein
MVVTNYASQSRPPIPPPVGAFKYKRQNVEGLVSKTPKNRPIASRGAADTRHFRLAEALVFSGSARLFTCNKQARFYAVGQGPRPPVAAQAPSLL